MASNKDGCGKVLRYVVVRDIVVMPIYLRKWMVEVKEKMKMRTTSNSFPHRGLGLVCLCMKIGKLSLMLLIT